MPVTVHHLRKASIIAATIAVGLVIGIFVRSRGEDADSPQLGPAQLGAEAEIPGDVSGEGPELRTGVPVAWDGMERVTIAEAYIPLARARSVEDLLPFTDGAAIVAVHGVAEQFRLYDERKAATAEDVEEFAAAGKTIREGQEIGPTGFLMTRLNATVHWLDGTTEETQLVVSGGIVDGKVHELEGMPLPGPGPTYFFFLRRAPEGLVPEAIQFVLEGDKLQPLTFPASGLSKALAGKSPDDIRDEVLTAYRNSPPKRQEAPRVSE